MPSLLIENKLTLSKETNAVTKYFLNPRWDIPADPSTFPNAITERLVGTHLKYVTLPLPQTSLVLTLDRCSVVIKSYQPNDELGVLTIIESVQPSGESPQNASQQTLLTIALETIMRSSQVSK